MNLPRRVFLDTPFLIALLNSQDEDHTTAVSLQAELTAQKVCKVTSEYILLELCDGLAKLRYRHLAVQCVELLKRDQTFEIIATSGEVLQSAWKLFRSRTDKEWGLTDCTSFVIMQKNSLNTALTTDRHFSQAGFHTLLLEI